SQPDELSTSKEKRANLHHTVKRRETASSAYGTNNKGDFLLGLHVALILGEVSHTILGDPATRMDYNMQSDSFTKLGIILDETRAGECGVADELMALVSSQVSDMLELVKPSVELPFVVFERATLLQSKDAIDQYFEQIRLGSDVPGIVAMYDDKDTTEPADEKEQNDYWFMLSKFINQSLVRNVFPLTSSGSNRSRLT
ncbi:hypothetical protein HDV05_001656, partial [Chytridiales sp. JEL 0842]